jgi:hypothetical protein
MHYYSTVLEYYNYALLYCTRVLMCLQFTWSTVANATKTFESNNKIQYTIIMYLFNCVLNISWTSQLSHDSDSKSVIPVSISGTLAEQRHVKGDCFHPPSPLVTVPAWVTVDQLSGPILEVLLTSFTPKVLCPRRDIRLYFCLLPRPAFLGQKVPFTSYRQCLRRVRT